MKHGKSDEANTSGGIKRGWVQTSAISVCLHAITVRSSSLLTAPQPTRHTRCCKRVWICVRTTIYCNTSVAAGACPTDQRGGREQDTQHTNGVLESQNTSDQICLDYRSGLASKTTDAPQTGVARHPAIPISIVVNQIHSFSIILFSDHRSGTEVLAWGLIGTCAQIKIMLIMSALGEQQP